MIVNGTVVTTDIDVNIAKKDGGTYPGSRVSYRDETGKLVEQAFHNNAFKFNPSLKNIVTSLKPGDNISITKEKEGEYWNVKAIAKTERGFTTDKVDVVAALQPKASPKSTYETPEERANRQVLIVRQSSVSSAVALLASNGGKKNTAAEAIAVAKEFEAYVFGLDPVSVSEETNEDDIL